MKLQEILSALEEYAPDVDVGMIKRAHVFIQKHHAGQTRASGEPYITHVCEVAFIATKLKLDGASITAALLHDTVEDTGVSLDEIREQFSDEVAALVDGVTKLSKVNFSSKTEHQAETFRKMLLAIAEDIRVLLIKLCDRLHNMQTLQFLSESRRVRIAQETLEIYAPLAHRLGIHWMKSDLEDLSFRFLKPEMYEHIKQKVNVKRKQREEYIESVVALISNRLKENGITAFVSGRPKHFFSIYQKMERQGIDFDDVYDLIAFRIIVDSLMECYAALGVVHAYWKPIPGRFKDFIAMPKANRYQSLHSTVIGPEGARIEFQIRTKDMHDIAEKGIAAHWQYKEGGSIKRGAQDLEQFSWLRELIQNEQDNKDPYEFISTVKADLYSREVFVFTPKGDLVALSAGSTPVDFAYAIHSEVGDHCSGARVNGRQVPLSYALRNGDTVEIVTSSAQAPNKDWLRTVATTRARQRIRAWLKGEERSRSIVVGKELLNRDLRKVNLNLSKLTKDGAFQSVLTENNCQTEEDLFAEIGYGKVSASQVVQRLLPNDSHVEEKLQQEESTIRRIFNKAARAFREDAPVKVTGLDDLVFRFARCCDPLPGDDIVGYVTRGRGVTIHSRSCTQAYGFDRQRIVDVCWDNSANLQRKIYLKVSSLDRIGLLASMTQAISSVGANIVSASSSTTPEGKALNSFEVAVQSASQLQSVIRALERVQGVLRVERERRAEDPPH